MPMWNLLLLIVVVAVMGTVGGAATRYERYGPADQRGPAGALAVVSLILAVTVALTVFGIATVQTEGVAWRLLGLACAGGIFGGLVAARGVDHFLVLRSHRQALAALVEDARRGGRSVAGLTRFVPWQALADACSGSRTDALRRDVGPR